MLRVIGLFQYYSEGSVSIIYSGYYDVKYPIAGGMSGGPTFLLSKPDQAIGVNAAVRTLLGNSGIITKISSSILDAIIDNL